MSCGSCNKSVAQTVVAGVVGMSKVALGIDIAPEDIIESRRDKCRQCEHASRNRSDKFKKFNGLTSFSRCAKCNCFIAAKTKLEAEKCPKGLW